MDDTKLQERIDNLENRFEWLDAGKFKIDEKTIYRNIDLVLMGFGTNFLAAERSRGRLKYLLGSKKQYYYLGKWILDWFEKHAARNV